MHTLQLPLPRRLWAEFRQEVWDGCRQGATKAGALPFPSAALGGGGGATPLRSTHETEVQSTPSFAYAENRRRTKDQHGSCHTIMYRLAMDTRIFEHTDVHGSMYICRLPPKIRDPASPPTVPSSDAASRTVVSSAVSAVGAGLGATGEGVGDEGGAVRAAEGAGVGDKVVGAGVGAGVGAPEVGVFFVFWWWRLVEGGMQRYGSMKLEQFIAEGAVEVKRGGGSIYRRQRRVAAQQGWKHSI